MKNTKKIFGFTFLLLIMMFAASFTGCSSFPTAPLVGNVQMSYEILGYVGHNYPSYEAAFTAARAAYPNADAVIKINGRVNDQLFPGTRTFGFYAVKFVPGEKTSGGLFSKN